MFEFSRNIRDKQKDVSVVLAQAGAFTPPIDLEQVRGGDLENLVAQIDIPAVAGIADTKALTFTLQDSADGVNFAAVDPLTSSTVTGVSTNGSPAKDVRFRFPPITRRYVRIAQTAAATSGAFTGEFGFRLLF